MADALSTLSRSSNNRVSKSAEVASANSFEVLAICGTGAYGRVLMVRSATDGRVYAMKCVDKTSVVQKGQNSITQAIAENELLKMMNHPYVVSLHWSFQDTTNLYMVLDYAGGGDLFTLIDKRRRLPEDWVRVYGAQLVLALEHCHAQGIVYRDLKPENVMVTLEGHLLLTDFGLSKRLGDPQTTPDAQLRTRTVCGTPSYMAPEALSGRPYGRAVDWWTLGCVIFEMAVGMPPFSDDVLAMLVRKITAGAYQVPSWLSPELINLLKSLLHLDPAVRLGSDSGGVAKLKTHPFFSSIDWSSLEAKKVAPPQMPGAADATDSDGSAASYGNGSVGADSLKGLAELESGFRPFGRTLEPASTTGGRGRAPLPHTALDGTSVELALDGVIVGVSKRFARLMHISRRPMPLNDPNPEQYVVGHSLADISVIDARDVPAVKAAVEGATRNLEAAILSSFNGDELPEHIELCVRVWPRGSARTAASKVPSAADATAIVPATAEAELTEQLLTQDSSMRFVRLRFEVVLTGGSEEISTSGTVSMTPVMRHDSSDGLSAVIIVQMNDQTGNELAKALVRRRNDWAYKERRGADDLAKVLDRHMDFQESSTKASLAVSANAVSEVHGADGEGFKAYLIRRDRFLVAFPDMARTLNSIKISDNGTEALSHWEWTGTHLGDYCATDYDGTLLVLAPTGAPVTCSGISIDGIRDGKIVRHQAFYDEAAMRAQISSGRMTALRARNGTGSATAGALDAIRRAPSAPPLDSETSCQLIDAACGDGLALIDTGEWPASILYANKAFCKSTGYSLIELASSPAGIKLLVGPATSSGSVQQLEGALEEGKSRRLMIALRTKADDTFIALLALAPVKPGAPLLALWRARALYSAAAAAEAVAVEGDDDGDASAHAAGLLAEARRDASLIVRLETGQLYAMAMLDMSYMPEDMAVDAAAQQALQALSLGDHGQATRTALAAEDADGARAFAAGMPTLARGPVPRRTVDAHRQARTDLQGALIGIPRHMGIMPQTVRDSLQRARDRPWPAKTGSDSAAPPMTPPVTPKSNVGDPPSGSPRSSPRSSQHAEWPSAPLTTEQLLLRTCIESDGYAVVISEMGSRDQPLVYINAGFAAVTHYSAEDCLGHNCRFLQSNLTDPASVMLLKWAIAAREPCRVQLLNVTRQGRPFWNMLSLHPCVEANGRADYYLGVQVEIEPNELGAVLIEVHKWRRARRVASASD